MGNDKFTLLLDKAQFTLLLDVLLNYDDEGPVGAGWHSEEVGNLHEYISKVASAEQEEIIPLPWDFHCIRCKKGIQDVIVWWNGETEQVEHYCKTCFQGKKAEVKLAESEEGRNETYPS